MSFIYLPVSLRASLLLHFLVGALLLEVRDLLQQVEAPWPVPVLVVLLALCPH